MKKIELIWRDILTEALEKREILFSQKDLAIKFDVSTSTVFHALKIPREIGAVEVTGRNFSLIDFEKLLFFWATQRNLKRDISYSTYSPLPIREIEGLMPKVVIPTAYTSYRWRFNETPADYDKVYFYSLSLGEVAERFPKNQGTEPNIFILEADQWLNRYTPTPPLVQLFVDLWNLDQWYAKEFQQALLSRFKETLGSA